MLGIFLKLYENTSFHEEMFDGMRLYPGSVRHGPLGSSVRWDKHLCGAHSGSCRSYHCCHILTSCGAYSSAERAEYEGKQIKTNRLLAAQQWIDSGPPNQSSPLCTGSSAPPSRWRHTLCPPHRTHWHKLCSCSAAPEWHRNCQHLTCCFYTLGGAAVYTAWLQDGDTNILFWRGLERNTYRQNVDQRLKAAQYGFTGKRWDG